ncbi:MAG: fimbrillin family protein, partial [Alistipes sp.]|nr:fimbrillin family protein [Alistipes sp.]
VGYMACALLALGVTACEQEGDELSTPMTTGEKISFSAEIDDNAGRTMLADDGYTVTWKGDEEIGVFYTTTPENGSNTTQRRNAKYTLSAGAGTASATLTGDIEWVDIVAGDHKFQMYYPYNADVTSPSAGYGTLPTEQKYDPAGWDISDYAFMVSGTASSKTLGENPTVTFKHLFSVLRFHVVNATGKDLTIEKLTVTSKNGLILAGVFQANVGKSDTYEALRNTTTEGETTNGYFKTAASSITTTLPEDTVVKAGEEKDIRVMINAGLVDGSTTEYYLEGETLAVDLYTTGNPVWSTEFKAGKLDRGARATKKLTISAFDNSALTVSAITPNHDAESTKFYLNTVATATGLNLGAIEKVTVDGKEVPATGLQVSDNQIIFKIPDTIEKTTATSCKVVGYDSADTAYELGSIMVYPFFYYKDVQLGLGSDAHNAYTEYASQNAFFVPDLGKVISAKVWYDTPIDGYAVAADKQAIAGAVPTKTEVTNSAINKNVLNKENVTAAQYYANMPYV